MPRHHSDHSLLADAGFFAHLPAVLLAGAAIAAILVVNQPKPATAVDAASGAIVPAATSIQANPIKTQVVASRVTPA